jgi:phage terminase large subunit GpA-like protein
LTDTSTISTTSFKSLGHIVATVADMFRPPERLSVSEAAEKYVVLNNPGGYIGPYQNRQAPYMMEPMNTLASRTHKGLVFCSSAQSGKTQGLILNWAGYNAVVDPMDMLIFCPTHASARDFSVRRIDRLHRYSPEVGKKIAHSRDADNKFDKTYSSGVLLTLSWPSVTELAGRPVPRIAMTDYDRMDDDIDGEGSPYDLGSKRTTTFGSFAMCVAESSPSRPITDPKWISRSKHEAPPCMGILGLYNRGDRRRWYWPCPSCGEFFEGNFKMLEWDTTIRNPMTASETARMICPCCSHKIHPDERFDMNLKGVWLKDGEQIENGEIKGDSERAEIASFWLNGVAASFITWPRLVQLFIDAEREYERTASEDSLKKFYNNDLGEPYLPKSMETERLPEVLKSRAEELPAAHVPPGVRFLVATVDVQKNAFVVQVHGVVPGEPHDIVVIDRFQIRKSFRTDEDGDVEWVRPGSYLEDWDLITDQVIKRTYPLADGEDGEPNSGRRMMIKQVACDSGGRAGVTTNAYDYYRKLRKDGLHGRFHLVKGDTIPTAPRVRITYPDSAVSKTDKKKAAAQGDVPVMLLNPTVLKDTLANRLDCVLPGKGMIRFGNWLPDWFYAELCAEQRDEKGWHNPSHTRNEAWDLMYYCIGVCVSPLLRVESLDWSNPPLWAAEWDRNALVTAPNQETRFAGKKLEDYDFKRFARTLA